VTQGYACPGAHCPYYGITDSRVHALVGYGHHGATDRIQDFRCQACGTKVSARRGTALYHLKTPPARVGEVLSALAEGLDVAAAVRVFGHGEGTITLAGAGWPAGGAPPSPRVPAVVAGSSIRGQVLARTIIDCEQIGPDRGTGHDRDSSRPTGRSASKIAVEGQAG